MCRSSVMAIVATSATAMPEIPKVLPTLDVSCFDSPANARMNSSAATMYAAEAAVSTVNMDFAPIGYGRVQLRENMASMRRVTAKPPKTLMLAKRMATQEITMIARSAWAI